MYRRYVGLSVLCSLLAACSGGGGGGGPPPNVAPTASAGLDREVGENTSVTLAGTGADSDGSIPSIRWTQTSGVSVILNAGDTYAPYFVAPDVTTGATLEFTLTVVDNQGASAADSIRVQVLPSIWENGVALRDSRWGLAACALANKIYVFGGADFETLSEQFDVATQSWTTLASTIGRRYGHACAVGGGKIYVMGGYDDDGLSTTPLDNVEAFDPATNSWSAQAPMPTPRYNVAAATLNGKIYAIGGRNNTANTLSTVEEFDPASGTWSTKASLPIALHSPAAAVVAGKLYAIGGFGANGTLLGDTYEYDLATNAWRQLASMAMERLAHSAVVVDGRIYVFGGQSSAPDADASVEMYDPATDQWTRKTDMPNARQYHASVTVDNSVYLLGGRQTSQPPQPVVSVVDIYNPTQDH